LKSASSGSTRLAEEDWLFWTNVLAVPKSANVSLFEVSVNQPRVPL
jgi:hypothetical protein